MNKTKFCRDCTHYRGVRFVGGYAAFPPACFHPEMLDIVTGMGSSPDINRGPFGKCGKCAKLFEQRPPEEPKKKRRWFCWGGA